MVRMLLAIVFIICACLPLATSTEKKPLLHQHQNCPDYYMVDTTVAMRQSSTTPSEATLRCDQTAGYFPQGRYFNYIRLQGPGGTGISTQQPKRTGVCGTTYPGWIQGKNPRPFGMTTGKLCYYKQLADHTCPDNFDCPDYLEVDIFNCAGKFFLYQLHRKSSTPQENCAKAFCTDDIGVCELQTFRNIPTLPEMTVNYPSPDTASELRCDKNADYVDGSTWIRLQGSGGTEMIHKQPATKTGVCGTEHPGWIVGTKPKQLGTVAQRTLCYSKGSDGQCTDGRRIDVMNCLNFMLYRLHSSSSSSQCSKAFCTEKPVYDDICDPKSHDTIVARGMSTRHYKTTPVRQNDDQYANKKTWMRLEGGDGSKVITTTKREENGRCNVDNPGWMEGEIPQATEGIVQRKLCYYDKSKSIPCPHARNIGVANCGSFMLYRFHKASTPASSGFCLEFNTPGPCYYRPCLHGGECVANGPCYKCNCPDGVSGKNCETDINNECDSNPCQNGGTCLDEAVKYTCKCTTGFTGTNCETIKKTLLHSHPNCPDYYMVDTTVAMRQSSTTPSEATLRCDQTAGYFPQGRYFNYIRLQGPGGTGISTQQPKRTGVCGTTYPGWIQGKNPRPFGMTTGKLCYYKQPADHTCPDNFDCPDYLEVDIFNCAGEFLLYQLHRKSSTPQENCAKAFCTDDIGVCELQTFRNIPTLSEMTVNYPSPDKASELRCDKNADYVDGSTWIRLQGSGGTEMIHKQPATTAGVCGTEHPGWIVGTKPKQLGTVAQRTLCYSKGSDGQCTDGRRIDVMNCLNFMLYRLHSSSSSSSSQCSKAFCTEKPVYDDICDPKSHDTIVARGMSTRHYKTTPVRQNDDQYADGKTWMRLEAGDGSKVITTTNLNENGRCNVDNPGWMEGEIPQATEGIVQRKLCYYDKSKSIPCPHARNIDVANCGSFMLYRFHKASTPTSSGFCLEFNTPGPCYYRPCLRGAECVANGPCYKCNCPVGVSGKNCETDINNDCDSHPCQNGGTCFDEAVKYRCKCTIRFTGTNCETEIDKCTPNPCKNGGTCTKNGDGYNCKCPSTYTGDNCETKVTDVDGCSPNPCKNFGSCTDVKKPFECKCLFLWSGKTCEDDKDIQDIFKEIGLHYDDDGGGGGGFWSFLGGLFGGIFGGLASLFGGLPGLFSSLGSLGNLGNSLNNFNNGRNPKTPKFRCSRMNLGSALKGFQSGNDKCKRKYDNKKCSIREKAKPNKPDQKPKPTEKPTGKPTEKPTEQPTEEPSSACTATCSAVENPQHGERIGDKTGCGDSVSFSCETGYKLTDCKEPQCKITCQHDGQWSSQPPKCIKTTCGGLVTLSSSEPRRVIEAKSTLSGSTDCNWAVTSDKQTAVITVRINKFNFPNSISSKGTCQDYVEVVLGTTRQRYCGAKPEHDVTIYNTGLIRFHSSSTSSSSFKLELSLETSCAPPSRLFRRAGGSCAICTASSRNAEQWPNNMPILFDSRFNIKLPSKAGVLSFSNGEKLTARCTNTEFTKYAVEEVEFECDDGKFTVTAAGTVTTGERFKDLTCTQKLTPEIWNDANKLHIGWKKPDITQMVITYDKPFKRPLYVQHTIFGKIALWKENDKGRPGVFSNIKKFLKGYTDVEKLQITKDYQEVNQDGYKRKEQLTRIEKVQKGLGYKYIDCCVANYLVKGHLAPNADFSFKSWRDATFFIVNVAAQWQGINAGNWFYLEDEVRNYAYQRQDNVKVISGVHGELELDTHKIEIPEAGSPVPTHFWKIVYDEGLDAAVAFVILNNPYAVLGADGLPTGSDRLCPTQCKYLGDVQTVSKGIMMCCSYTDFKASLPANSVPTINPASNLFDSMNVAAVKFGGDLLAKIK